MKVSVIILISTIALIALPQTWKENEEQIIHGIERFYHFNIRTPDKLYFLNNTRYNEYSKVFTATISKVDSSDEIGNYRLERKEIQLVVDSLAVNSVYISVDIHQIKKIITN